ncbi:amidohydrolase family protein [Shewanella submarina]|uniref:Amidohydrolase family protein n=1 Tax=Shewanella submarina TaxID=2016376 RepID=A0ABV7GHS8_9GAMM|nr:amidohydrolase family protein [Shewanella submarina]MCL1035949.1 amidohydrolase family protein [Shewanella submarina]
MSAQQQSTTKGKSRRWVQWIMKGGLWLGAVSLTLVVLFIYSAHGDIKKLYGADTQLVDSSQFMPTDGPLLIRNVSILSPNGEQMLPATDVLIEDGKIAAIGDDIVAPKKLFEVDGAGKFLIPGLVDSHAHVMHSENDLLLYLANGVTHIRELAGSEKHLALRDEIGAGRLGPRMYVASPQLDTDGFWLGLYRDFTRFSRNVYDPETAREVVWELDRKGYDAIKLYDLNVETYRAINAEAGIAGIPTLGHLPVDMDLDELSSTGQQEIAHIEELVKLLLRDFGSVRQQGTDAFRDFAAERSDRIAKDLAGNQIAVHSVLWFMESIERQFDDLENLLGEVRLEYANPGIVEGNQYAGFGWLPERNRFRRDDADSVEENELLMDFWQARKDAHHLLLKAMIANGVVLLAATDSNADLVVPGFSLHDELQSLNQAGMSIPEVLKSATSHPADLMNSNAGYIEEGKRADLVLLNKNPLVQMGNTRSIEAVIVNGRYLQRKQLDAMLQSVKEANNRSREMDIGHYL